MQGVSKMEGGGRKGGRGGCRGGEGGMGGRGGGSPQLVVIPPNMSLPVVVHLRESYLL